MKICILTTGYLPKIGGVEIVTHNLSKELIRLGHEIHIITPSEDVSSSTITPDGMFLHRIHVYHHSQAETMSPYLKIILGVKLVLDMIHLIWRIKPEIIHAQNVTNAVPAWCSKVLWRIPYCIQFHNELSLMGPTLPQKLIKYWKKLPYLKDANEVIVLTKIMYDETYNATGISAKIIPNGVDTSIFHPNFKNAEENVVPTLICVSRLDNKKGIEYAIESVHSLVKEYPESRLLIIGDGDFRKYLENMVTTLELSKNIEFLGSIPNIQVANYLREADIFLLPSLSEGLPLTLLEAMACGLPIIATPVSIVPEIIQKWNNGIIVSFKSSDEITNAVRQMVETGLVSKLGSNSYHASKCTYSWSVISKKYEELYSQILQKIQ